MAKFKKMANQLLYFLFLSLIYKRKIKMDDHEQQKDRGSDG